MTDTLPDDWMQTVMASTRPVAMWSALADDTPAPPPPPRDYVAEALQEIDDFLNRRDP